MRLPINAWCASMKMSRPDLRTASHLKSSSTKLCCETAKSKEARAKGRARRTESCSLPLPLCSYPFALISLPLLQQLKVVRDDRLGLGGAAGAANRFELRLLCSVDGCFLEQGRA